MLAATVKNTGHLRLPVRIIALLQVIVMLVLAVPVCADEMPTVEKKSHVAAVAGATDTDDDCPCCPVDGAADSDNCSTCSFCSSYTPLTSAVPVPRYAPIVAPLVAYEEAPYLPEVPQAIYTPPQNA